MNEEYIGDSYRYWITFHGFMVVPATPGIHKVAWYESDQYKANLPARFDKTTNTSFAIVDGVGDLG